MLRLLFLAAVLVVVAEPPFARAETFVDATASAGIGYLQHLPNDPPDCLFVGVFCEPERMSGAAAVGDVDGDGRADLLVTRLEAHDLLFRNLGGGAFEDATPGSGLEAFALDSNGAAFADVDRDGDLDLYVLSITGTRFHLFINDGTGQFTEEAVARGAAVETANPHFGWSAAVGDYDRDGYPDLFVGEWRPAGVAGNPAVSHSRLLHNLGVAAPGEFEDVTIAAGVAPESIHAQESWVFAPAFVDLDGDGWQDLALASDFGTSLLFWNDRDGTFTEDTVGAAVGTDENGMGSTFGDYDGDGDLDWFVTSIFDAAPPCDEDECNWGGTGNRLYRYDGGRQFSDATDEAGVRDGYWGWGTAFFDSDNDGDLDLVMTNGVDFPESQAGALDDPWEADPMRFWRNDGTGVFAEASAAVGLTDTASGKGLLAWDYDEDGDLDILLVNNALGARLYENVGGNSNDWLRVRVSHRYSATPVQGARVEVQPWPGGSWQVRQLGADAHFLAQGEAIAHFGLGAPSLAPLRVRVTYPDGRVAQRLIFDRNRTLVFRDRACGLLGIEGLAAVGAASLWLRRRARARRR